jgi:putative sigma-54 modulation protein
MNVTITARHAEISDPMRSYANQKAEWLGGHFEFVTNVQVTLNLNARLHSAEVIALTRKGERIVASADGEDMYRTMDAAVEKITNQLHRFKEKIKAHRPPGAGKEPE